MVRQRGEHSSPSHSLVLLDDTYALNHILCTGAASAQKFTHSLCEDFTRPFPFQIRISTPLQRHRRNNSNDNLRRASSRRCRSCTAARTDLRLTSRPLSCPIPSRRTPPRSTIPASSCLAARLKLCGGCKTLLCLHWQIVAWKNIPATVGGFRDSFG